jgi:hypothetical protein
VVSEAAILNVSDDGGDSYTKTFALASKSLSEHFSRVSGSTAFMMLPIIVRFSKLSHLIRRIEFCENCGVSPAGTGSQHLQRFVSRLS